MHSLASERRDAGEVDAKGLRVSRDLMEAVVTDGLALLVAWVGFVLLLGLLAFVVLRGDREKSR